MSDDDPIDQLPRGIALAWGVAAAPQRGPKREMSVERIVDAAIEIADQEGIQAVSMSAVAKRLGYTPMSLYRYVSAKDDLLLLMQEEATGLPPEWGGGSSDWRTRLVELYDAQTEIYRRQPWLLSLPIMGSPVTPNSSAWLDASLEALAATPLTEEEAVAAALLVTGLARWKGTIHAGYTEKRRVSGMTDTELAAHESQLFDTVITLDAYPSLRRAIDAGVFVSESDPFDFGFVRSLDGLTDYIETVSRARGADVESATSSKPRTGDGGQEGAETCPPKSLGGGDEKPAIADDDPDVLADRKHREALKAVRQAQKVLAEARKRERQTLREAKERIAKRR
ncbi:TetR family transcriptional regulator [Brevibacterium casei]|uniref:TetR family transcriptional regulator n=1 Tax=Brevibacterium casei TaxID=33889 RepID=A0A269Z5J5_9MICO|nr:TetR/AcrR family transcriptional regulator [Brevibacterium casei]PAK93064.1 TetR family transcriptional regulator [Brevibacterium casei]